MKFLTSKECIAALLILTAVHVSAVAPSFPVDNLAVGQSSLSGGCADLVIDSVEIHLGDCAMIQSEIIISAHSPNGAIYYSIDSGYNFQSDSIFTGVQDGSYYLLIMDNNCVTNYSNNPVIIADPPPPEPDLLFNGISLGTTGSYASVGWNCNGQHVSGAYGSSYTPTQSGYYYITVQDYGGCHGTSDTVFVSISSVNDLSESVVTVKPNPFIDEINVTVEGASWMKTATLFDLFGRRIIESPFPGENLNLGTSKLTQGVYILRLTIGNETVYRQIVKQ